MKKYIPHIFITIGMTFLANGALHAGDIVAMGSGTSNARNELVLFDSLTRSDITAHDNGLFGEIYSLAWSNDGYLLTGGSDATDGIAVYEYSTQGLTPCARAGLPSESIADVSWSPDSSYFATVSSLNHLVTWNFDRDAGTATVIDDITPPNVSYPVISVDWHPRHRRIAVGTFTQSPADNQVVIYSVRKDGSIRREVAGASLNVPGAYWLRWSPDGKHLAVCDNNKVSIFSYRRNTLTVVDTATKPLVVDLAWSPDGDFLATTNAQLSGEQLNVFSFDGLALLQVGGLALGESTHAVGWTGDGNTVVVGGNAPSSGCAGSYHGIAFDSQTGVLTPLWTRSHDGSIRAIDVFTH